MIKYLSIMLLLGSACGVQAMGYIKGWFQEEKCLEGKPERQKFYDALKKDIKEGKLVDTNKVFSSSLRTGGTDTCVHREIGKEEATNLYTAIIKVIADSAKPEFFKPENLSNARRTLEDARTSLNMIHLGASDIGPEYKIADEGLKKAQATLKEHEAVADAAAVKAKVAEEMKKSFGGRRS